MRKECTHPLEVLVSFDFLPKIGGAHLWMYEVYKRWPDPVTVLTGQYAVDPVMHARELAFDAEDHGLLRIVRCVSEMDINITRLSFWKALRAQLVELRRLAQEGSSPGQLRLHSLRAFPEGILALAFKLLHPRRAVMVTYAHGEEILIAQTSRQLSWLSRYVYRNSDVVIVNSANTQDILRQFCPEAKSIIVRPGVDVASFQLDALEVSEFRRSLGWSSDTAVVATVARMEARKNHEGVLRAIAELRKSDIAVAYVCAGDGPERKRLETLATELGIEAWVRFPGAVTDHTKKLIYAASDVHAMPSIQKGEMIEGFGIVFLEAAAVGVVSVCGNSGGQAEAVQENRTGLVVDGTSVPELVAALGRLVREPELRARMGIESKRWATAHDWSTVVANTQAAIPQPHK